MKIPYIDLYGQYLSAKDDIDKAIADCIKSGMFFAGKQNEVFETTIANISGYPACASCGSGSDALILALKACNIKPGDEVITVSHTFVSTVEAIVSVGAVPVFVDIDEQFYHINFDNIEDAISQRTKAILFVDLYGQIPNLSRLRNLATHYNLYLIEDAAQSFGAAYKGDSYADMKCVSFNPLKNLAAMGDAGCVLGKSYLIDKVRKFRDHGRVVKNSSECIGISSRIDNIQSAVIMAKLPYFMKWISRKQEIARYYTDSLKNHVICPNIVPWGTHAYYSYVIRADQRNSLQTSLMEAGIETRIQYEIPVHHQPAYKNFWISDNLKITDKISKQILSLPCYHTLPDSSVNKIVETIKSCTS